jgi:hypothetical protein
MRVSAINARELLERLTKRLLSLVLGASKAGNAGLRVSGLQLAVRPFANKGLLNHISPIGPISLILSRSQKAFRPTLNC